MGGKIDKTIKSVEVRYCLYEFFWIALVQQGVV